MVPRYTSYMQLRRFFPVALILFISFCASIGVARAWTGPIATPPGGNVAAPVNIGTSAQYKGGNLGVGQTTLPVFTFEANGSSLINGALILYGTSRYLNFGTNSGTGGYGFRDNAGTIEYKNNAGAWTSFAASGVWATGGLNIYNTNTGNVGVGTANPIRKLDIANGLTSAGNGSVRVSGYQAAFEVFNAASTANWYFGNNDADGNKLYIGRGYGPNQGVAPVIAISQGESVGIGTASPGSKLHVNGGRVEFGSTGTNYLPSASNWNYTLQLDGLDTTSIGFHDSAASVSSIRYNNSGFVIGGDDGWGVRNVSMPGNVAAGASVTSPKYCIGASCITEWPGGIGPGTVDRISRWVTATTLGDSSISSDGISSTAIGNFFVTGNEYLTGNETITNTSPTIYLADSDHRSAMIHNNSNQLYILRGCGAGSTNWCALNGVWPLTINLENNDATFGGAVSATGAVYTNDYFRVNGNGGLYWQNWGGGWYMSDDTWVRSYNNKSVFTAGRMRADAGFCIGASCITEWPNAGLDGSGTPGSIPRLATATTLGYSSLASDGISSTATGNFFVTSRIFSGAAGTGGMWVDGGTSQFVGSLSASALGLWNNGAWRLAVDSSGNVGIGANAPSQKLDVNGYVRVRSINNEGGTIQLDGQNGTKVYVENINGVFRLVNNPWSATMFSVDQTGRTSVGENLYVGNYLQTTGAARVGSFLIVDGHNGGTAIDAPNGNIRTNGYMYAAAYVYNSDARLKKDIASLSGSLDKVLQLRPVSYLLKDPSAQTAGAQFGFVAQDVERVVPEIVHTDDSGMKGIDYVRLTPLLVGSVQELNAKIDAQQQEIDELRAQIQQLVEN